MTDGVVLGHINLSKFIRDFIVLIYTSDDGV